MKPGAVIAAIEKLDEVDAANTGSPQCTELLGDVRLVRGWLDAVEARITSRVTELYESAGGAPAADLHTRCGGVSSADGRRKERRSKAIDEAPAFGDALADGQIGAEHVDALANATSKLDDDIKTSLFDDTLGLINAASTMSPEKFGRHLRDRARQLERDNGVERNERQRRATFLSRKLNLHTGMVKGRFAFHPELGNQIMAAIDRQVAAIVAEGERSGDPAFAHRRPDRNRLAADALGMLVAGGHQAVRPLEADITVIVDEQTASTGALHEHSVCETSDGIELPAPSVRRLLCNGQVTPIIINSDGTALDAGRTIRHASRKQRRALRAMYRTCAFQGCEAAFERCEIHHITEWRHGGSTDLHNLIPLCSRHHHVVHELGWSLKLEPNRTLVIIHADGTEFARTQPDIAEHFRTQHRRRQPAA